MTLPTLNIRKVVADDSGPEGFVGQLERLTLADLVQLECLSGNRVSILVRSRGKTGQLHFDKGELVHAATGAIVGDAAALEILDWTSGSFALWDGPWPGRVSVHHPWQHLLMTAAQRSDERKRTRPEHAAPEEGSSQMFELTTFRNVRTQEMFPRDEFDFDDEVPAELPTAAPPESRRRPSAAAAARADTTEAGTLKTASPRVDVAIRKLLCLDASGRATRRIGDCRTLDQATPTLTRLAAEIGEALGLQWFREGVFERASCRWYLSTDAKGQSVTAELDAQTPLDGIGPLLTGEV